MPYDFRPNEIFGIEDAAPSSLTGTELLYESELGKPGGPDYLREEVRRNRAGKYYMYVKSGVPAISTTYPMILRVRNLLSQLRQKRLRYGLGSVYAAAISPVPLRALTATLKSRKRSGNTSGAQMRPSPDSSMNT